MMRDSLERVTKSEPCKICGKPDYCCRLTRFHWCMRVESPRPHEKGGWLHLNEEANPQEPLPPRAVRKPDSELRAHWEPIAMDAAAAGRKKIPLLAAQLGVDAESLIRLNVGHAHLGGVECWTFPERNAKGWIVGISRRLVTPKDGRTKMQAKGSRRALSYCDGWHEAGGVIWLVEGGSDTAAGLMMGMCVVGRPSNVGGVDQLASLLRSHSGRLIMVLGENDRKDAVAVQASNPQHNPECSGCLMCYPGLAGAYQTAKALAARLGRTVGCVMPPVGIKDLREYARAIGWQRLSHAERRSYGTRIHKGWLCYPPERGAAANPGDARVGGQAHGPGTRDGTVVPVGAGGGQGPCVCCAH